MQLLIGLAVQYDHVAVGSTDHEQRRRAHALQRVARQVRASSARDDRRTLQAGAPPPPARPPHPRWPRTVRSAAYAHRRARHPALRARAERQVDVEHVGQIDLLVTRQQVEPQRAQTARLQALPTSRLRRLRRLLPLPCPNTTNPFAPVECAQVAGELARSIRMGVDGSASSVGAQGPLHLGSYCAGPPAFRATTSALRPRLQGPPFRRPSLRARTASTDIAYGAAVPKF